MMPAAVSCPNGWSVEYSGYMMSISQRYHTSNGMCVDGNAEILPGSERDDNGALVHFLAASCIGSFLPCRPYITSVPLTCVVCSHF